MYQILKWAKKIFPFNRSLTGKGNLQTLNFIKDINKNLKIKYFKSGKKVFDWIVPKEWNVEEAYFIDSVGKKFCDFKKNNLHLVGYSCFVDKFVSKKELFQHLHTDENKKNAIPYVTSYYHRNWGFCISKNEKNKIKGNKFKVKINSSFKKGRMHYGEALIKGKQKKEIFFSTYICHPSMANNETSGICVTTALLKYISEKYKKTKYSYRFVFLPETIGSISYINKNLKIMKKNVLAGFNISCVGDERAYSIIHSRKGNTLADFALLSAIRDKKNFKKYSFLDRGSDERQYCSVGVDLPVVGFCKSRYGSFSEYHTSLDNFKVVTEKGLKDSLQVLTNIVDTFEMGYLPKAKFLCEPQLSKRNLYPKISKKINQVKLIRDLIAYSDGKISIFENCLRFNCNLKDLLDTYRILKTKGLIN
tara:strand:+ start:6068 stop:7324 length:1257 start_codon:yes stop_codon:yes gene_type:complete